MASNRNRQTALWIAVFGLLAATLVSCAVGTDRLLGYRSAGFGSDSGASAGPVMVGGPRVDHAAHIDRGLECSDCHELDEETGNLIPVPFDTCMDCHEELDEELPEGDPKRIVPTYFDAEGNPKFVQALIAYPDEVNFPHGNHIAKLKCIDCHGEMGGAVPREQKMLFDMAGCVSCHKKTPVKDGCATCHKEIRKDKLPPSHGAGWLQGHGIVSPTGSGIATAQKCDTCHNVPNDCRSCHMRTPPASHGTSAWKRSHGQTILGSRGPGAQQRCDMCHLYRQDCDQCHEREMPLSHRRNWTVRHGSMMRGAGATSFQAARCAYCHSDEQFCERCHLVEAPRNHSMLFRNKTHGLLASIDRESCKNCHQTPFCVRCHESVEPRSHRGMWASGRNTHCSQCHFPISSVPGCVVCHPRNPTHSSAPGMPAGHSAAWACRACHNSAGGGGAPPLKHFDNGQACQTCHQ